VVDLGLLRGGQRGTIPYIHRNPAMTHHRLGIALTRIRLGVLIVPCFGKPGFISRTRLKGR